MTATFASSYDEPAEHKYQPKRLPKRPAKLRGFADDRDIMRWLRGNAPGNWQELKDLRYCLYHRCSRAGFKVKRCNYDQFTLTGRASSLLIVSNSARHFLLWQLRMLGRKRGWVGRRKIRIEPLVASCL
jgi:hypothetical protein